MNEVEGSTSDTSMNAVQVFDLLHPSKRWDEEGYGPRVGVGIGVGVPWMDNTTSTVPGRIDSTNTFPFKGSTSGLS